MAFCAEHNVGVSFLSEHGRFLARIQGPIHGNVLLRREQYRRADEEAASADLARDPFCSRRSPTAGLRCYVLPVSTAEPLIVPLTQLGQSLRLLASAFS